MTWLETITSKENKLAVGLISGTSMDGIDAALVNIKGSGLDASVSLIDFICEDYSFETMQILTGIDGSFGYEKMSDLNFQIGMEFSDVAKKIISKNNYTPGDIDFIGSHGQTVFHNPPSQKNRFHSTLQIGETDVICEQTGITTVGDFRTMDIAAGGEGAPFIPYVDFVLFKDLPGNYICQNIGGIANSTYISSNWEDTMAYDSGPGNSLIDGTVKLATLGEKSFDNDGEIASSGSVNKQLFKKLSEHPYFDLPLPKSTGKELFGKDMVEEIYNYSKRNGIKLSDLLCTLVELTVETIVNSYEKYIFSKHRIDEIIVSGGGVFNVYMMERLRKKLPSRPIVFSDKYGFPADAKEAVGFAIFANEALHGNTTGISRITGALNDNVLGKISIGRNKIKNV